MSEWQAYQYLVINRLRKKFELYKEALNLLIDKTIAFYILLVVGYIIFAITRQKPELSLLDTYQTPVLSTLLIVLPFRYIFSSFTNPGVVISSSEYNLSRLPLRLKQIWLFAVLIDRGKRLLMYIIIGLLIVMFTSLTILDVAQYFGVFLIYDCVMVIPQWKLFQQSLWKKLLWLSITLIISAVAIFTRIEWSGFFVLFACAAIGIVLSKNAFRQVGWNRITESGDFKVWNMALIGAASRTKMRRPSKYQPRINAKKRRAPFESETALYRRLWQLYFRKNSELLSQAFGLLLIMLILFQWRPVWVFHIVIAGAVYAFVNIAAIVFGDRLKSDLIHMLPWNLKAYKKSYFYGLVLTGGVLFIPILVFYLVHWNVWAIPKMLLVLGTSAYMLELKLNKACLELKKSREVLPFGHDLSMIFILCIIFMAKFDWLSLGFILAFILWKRETVHK